MRTIPLPIGHYEINQKSEGSNNFTILLSGYNPKFDMTPEEYLTMVSSIKK